MNPPYLDIDVGAPLDIHLLPALALQLAPELPCVIAAHVATGLEQRWLTRDTRPQPLASAGGIWHPADLRAR